MTHQNKAGKMKRTRAIVFIDGSNWYHGLKKIGVNSNRLDYRRVAEKLLAGRELLEIRYYIGKVEKSIWRMRAQEKFFKSLRAQGVNIFLGRIEKNRMRPGRNPMIKTLRAILAEEQPRLPAELAEKLSRLCRHTVSYEVEKQVDVRIAVDLVSMAHRDKYDAAYVLSADGDFVPAVAEARELGKTIYAASAAKGAQIGDAVNTFIPLKPQWFAGLPGETT